MSTPNLLETGLYPQTRSSVLVNELMLAAGVTALGALAGFAYGYWKNARLRAAGVTPTSSELRDAFEGALFGLILIVFLIVLYRVILHFMSGYHTSKLASESAELQSQHLRTLYAPTTTTVTPPPIPPKPAGRGAAAAAAAVPAAH